MFLSQIRDRVPRNLKPDLVTIGFVRDLFAVGLYGLLPKLMRVVGV